MYRESNLNFFIVFVLKFKYRTALLLYRSLLQSNQSCEAPGFKFQIVISRFRNEICFTSIEYFFRPSGSWNCVEAILKFVDHPCLFALLLHQVDQQKKNTHSTLQLMHVSESFYIFNYQTRDNQYKKQQIVGRVFTKFKIIMSAIF